MKLLKVIIILSSLFVFSVNANGKDLKETEGELGAMPHPTFLGEDIKYSMPAFLFRLTQYMRFRLNKEEKKLHKAEYERERYKRNQRKILAQQAEYYDENRDEIKQRRKLRKGKTRD